MLFREPEAELEILPGGLQHHREDSRSQGADDCAAVFNVHERSSRKLHI
jgi:hypothetical protein